MAKGRLKSELTNFTILHNEFIETELLTGNEKLTFVALKRHLNSENSTAFPSIARIARYTGLSRSTIKRTLGELEKKGIITVESRVTAERGQISNLYTIHDYKAMWLSENISEVKQVIKKEREKELVAELQSMGYTVIKEKGLVSQAVQSRDTSTISNNNISFNSNDNIESVKSQCQERYSLEFVKEFFDYDIMAADRPDIVKTVDAVMHILYDVLNSNKEVIRIGGEDKPAPVVWGKILKLSHSDIIYVADKFNGQTERIRNVRGYLLTLLYHARDQRHLDETNLGHCRGDF